MLGWFRKKQIQQPTEYEIGSRVASVIAGFIQQHGLNEFSKARLCVVIAPEMRVSISEKNSVSDALVAVPLNELNLDIIAERPDLRDVSIDVAARTVIGKLRPSKTN